MIVNWEAVFDMSDHSDLSDLTETNARNNPNFLWYQKIYQCICPRMIKDERSLLDRRFVPIVSGGKWWLQFQKAYLVGVFFVGILFDIN